jgi:predicted dehydrogenase
MGAAWASKDPNQPDWRQIASRSGGGLVIDAAYHAFYVAEEELLSPVETVFASIGSYGGVDGLGVEDVATVVLAHRDGGTSCIQRCRLAKGGGMGAHEVHGTAGSIRFRQPDPKVLSAIFSGDYGALASVPRPDRPPVPVEIFENTVGEWRPLLEPPEPIPWWDGMNVIFAKTFDAWASGADAPVGIGEARHGLAIVRAAYLSAERGAAVELADVEGG